MKWSPELDFLVEMDMRLPAEMTAEYRIKLMAEERKYTDVLAANGTLVRMWRIPGTHANWGLWAAPDATALHEALSNLPLFPWFHIKVHPLAAHSFDPGPK